MPEQLRETLPGGTAFIHPIELSFLPTSPKIEVADVQSEQEFDVRLDDETILRTLEAVEQARRDGFLIE